MLIPDLRNSFSIVIAEKDGSSGSRIGGLPPEKACSIDKVDCRRCLQPLKYYLTLDLSEVIPDIDQPLFSVYACEQLDCLYDREGSLTPPGVHIAIHEMCPRQEPGSTAIEINFEGRKLRICSILGDGSPGRSKLFGTPDFLNDPPADLSSKFDQGNRLVFQFDEEEIIGKLDYKTAFFGFGTIYVFAKVVANPVGLSFNSPLFYWEPG